MCVDTYIRHIMLYKFEKRGSSAVISKSQRAFRCSCYARFKSDNKSLGEGYLTPEGKAEGRKGILVVFAGGKRRIVLDRRKLDSLGERATTGCGPAFVEWAQNEIAVVPDFHKRILFSDESHFWLNGYVNKQNCRIWSEANPQVYVETPLHPEKLTVWCALWAGGIIGLQKRWRPQRYSQW
ncbi:hypothetical protein TNCV_973131 [Trichonephila clavipes]|nr:hypothetical protein TNCV_973131 [Trichonephila clavipes]